MLIARRLIRALDCRLSGKNFMLIGALFGGLLAIGAGGFCLYLSQIKPLHPWSRNWFFRIIDAPEILDRILLVVVGVGFLLVGLGILISGIIGSVG